MNKKITYEILAYDWVMIDKNYIISYYTIVNGRAELISKLRELKKLYDKIIWYGNKEKRGCWEKKKRTVK